MAQREKKTEKRRVFSYYSSNDTVKSKGQRTYSKIHNIPFYVSLAIILFSIGYCMTLNSDPLIKISNIDKINNEKEIINIDRFNKIASEELESSYINLSKLTINTAKTEDNILSKIPEATDVAITLPIIGRSPTVFIRLAEPVAVLRSQSKYFLIDEKGRAVKEIEKPTTSLFLIEDKAALLIKTGSQAMTKQQIDFISNINKQLKRAKLYPKVYSLSDNANEILVSFKNKAFIGKYNLLSDPRQQSGTLIAALKNLKSKNIEPKEYIDVRVEERAYYK